MDMANPPVATLRAACVSPEQAAKLNGLNALVNFVLYDLTSQLEAIRILLGYMESCTAVEMDTGDANKADRVVEELYRGITGISRLLRSLEADVSSMDKTVLLAEQEADALIGARAALSPNTLAAIITSAGHADWAKYETVTESAKELHRLKTADRAYEPAFAAWNACMQDQGWKLTWGVSPDNAPYFKVTPSASWSGRFGSNQR